MATVAHQTQSSARDAADTHALDGVWHARIADLQRARILGAMLDVACERGAGNVTVAHLVERSGVSRRTFYESFVDRDECFFAAFKDALAHASGRVTPEYESQGSWRERVRAGLVAFLVFLEEQPLAGRVLVVESLAGEARTRELRARTIAQVTSAIDEGRGEAKADSVPPLAAEGVVGGALSVIHSRLLSAESEPLIGLANPLMSMIVLPYLGAAIARRELGLAVPSAKVEAHGTTQISDPFKDAGMRLTYRTARVLMVVREQPDASNRTVGEAAGIFDQGQVSKLLGRLRRIGLIENSGLGPRHGAPNKWALTAKGRMVTDSIRAHSDRQT